ncbi:MAG TPA: transcription termination/antitermination protein NusG [Candidatus Edwardsbacteria bacterium]|nr:transcription termination/antitermination protein NusG [Candidatus Edwardsbacteria bacterium]
MALRWYVLHTYAGHENRVKLALEAAVKARGLDGKIGRVLIPTEEVTELKKGKRKQSSKQLFPSYMMIEMDLTDEVWNMVSTTPGVTSFLGTRRKPQPMRDSEAQMLISRMQGDKRSGPVVIPYKKGETVRITDGPFATFTGLIDEIDPEHGRIKVMVTIFGRTTPVELDFMQITTL